MRSSTAESPQVFRKGEGERDEGGQAHSESGLSVYLTPNELRVAAVIGVLRNINGMGCEPVNKAYDWREAWENNIIGAFAEMAVAKALSLPYLPPDFCSDLPFGIEVRAVTRYNGELVVRDHDSSCKTYVLVIVELAKLPEVVVVGYISGWDAKRPEWRKAPLSRPPAYFVPQEALKKFSSTPKLSDFAKAF